MPSEEQKKAALQFVDELREEIDRVDFLLRITQSAFAAHKNHFDELVESHSQPVGNYRIKGSDVTIPFSEYQEIVTADSKEQQQIALLFLVWIYTLWEKKYRKAIAYALDIVRIVKRCGKPDKRVHQISCDAYGDLAKIRAAMVHHKGVKTGDMKNLKTITVYNELAVNEPLTCSQEQFAEICNILKNDLIATVQSA